jgi:glyoxylase-like metal-dependent hydrolase (beta-lactamase superfamily II)
VIQVPTNTLHELADGVWVWLQPGGESGVSNAGVIADDDGLTIVDTLMVRSQWEPFAAAVAKLGRPVRRIVLTHAHVDHVGGTKAFPMASVLGSPQTSQLLDGEMPLAGVRERVRRPRRGRYAARHPSRHRCCAAHRAHRGAPRGRAHRGRRDGARRRRRRAVRR